MELQYRKICTVLYDCMHLPYVQRIEFEVTFFQEKSAFCGPENTVSRSSCLHHASVVSETLFIVPTDAHYLKINVSVHAGTTLREQSCA